MKSWIVGMLSLFVGCGAGPGQATGYRLQATGSETAAAPTPTPAPTPVTAPAPDQATGYRLQATGSEAAPSSAPAPAPVPSSPTPPDPENRSLPPLSSPDLDERARHLFDAVASGRPEVALDFFFPREPFIPLKDVDDPGRYHDELVREYRHDVMSFHASRRSWEQASFEKFELATKPTWVAPGREWNKIGYFRTFDARLTYTVAGKRRTLTVRTIISWQGRWYVTHLAPRRPKPKPN